MAKGKYFIKESIKEPGSLRAYAEKHGGLTKDGKIDVRWATKLYNKLRNKPNKTAFMRKLMLKLRFFLKVLRKVNPHLK